MKLFRLFAASLPVSFRRALWDAGKVCVAAGLLLCPGPVCGQSVTATGDVSPAPPGPPLPVWNAGNELRVGNSHNGELTISDGGMVSSTVGSIGYNSTGKVTVTGADSIWNSASGLFVGDRGTGTLIISDGGRVSSTPTSSFSSSFIGFFGGSVGVVTVTGPGSTWANSGSLCVGDYGTGTLTISGGGYVSNVHSVIGANSTSTVMVTGAGSTWTNFGYLTVGMDGTGTLKVEDNGIVEVAEQISINSTSSLELKSGGTLRALADQADWIENSGTLSLGAGGGRIDTNGFSVGIGAGFSGSGSLTKTGAGTLTLTGANTYTGGTTVKSGTLAVSGSGASIAHTSGDLIVGDASGDNGTLTISGGGRVASGEGRIGNASFGSIGAVVVTGKDSTWTNTGELYVSYIGAGELTISNGGTVSNTVGHIGFGYVGAVAVQGTGSTWTNTGGLRMGYLGKGTLTVEDNGLVEANNISIFSGSSVQLKSDGTLRALSHHTNWIESSGTLSLGAGGGRIDTNGFNVGTGAVFSGSGSLTKTGAGTLTLTGANTYTGGTTVKTGVLAVSGSGASIAHDSGDLIVGDASDDDGTLAIADGGTVSVGGTTRVHANGTVNLQTGGTLQTGHLNASGAIYFTGGTLRAMSDQADWITNSGMLSLGTGGARIDSNGFSVGIGAVFSGSGPLTKTGAGTLTLSGANTYTGSTTISAGTLILGNALALQNSTLDYRSAGGSLGFGMLTTATFGGLSGDKAIVLSTIFASGLGLSVGGNSASTTYSGSLSGLGSLTKTGAGTLTLTGSNTQRAGTTVKTGILAVSGSGASIAHASANFIVGDASGDDGTLRIADGGSVSSRNSYIARSSGSTGTVTVTGKDSSWTNSDDLHVGDWGMGTLLISDGGRVSSMEGRIGYGYGSTGMVIVTGAGSTWAASGALRVGSGTGTLAISDGGEVSDDSAYIGFHNYSSGTVTVEGEDSIWTTTDGLHVGYDGTGELTISDGGKASSFWSHIGSRGGSKGTVTVRGKGSTWESVEVYLGYERGASGTLTISDGGGVFSAPAYIGYHSGSLGTVTVEGADSTWASNWEFSVGYNGTGELTISNGGKVSDRSGYIGYHDDSSGAVTVKGANSIWTNFLELYVGLDGSGTLTVEDHGIVEVAARIHINSISSLELKSGGTLRALANQANWIGNSGTLSLGAGGGRIDTNGFNVGIGAVFSGSGSLTKTGAGTLTLTGANTYTGGTTVKTGTLAVSGSGASIVHYPADLIVGDADGDNGELIISNGGKVYNNFGYIGNVGASSSGRVTVTGADSDWWNSYDLSVGRAGTGALTISDGGRVFNGLGHIGQYSGSTGAVTVSGNGSVWSNNGALRVGTKGKGTLRVENGGGVIATAIAIGDEVGSEGKVTVSGANATLRMTAGGSGALYVGNFGAGELRIEAGGRVSNEKGFISTQNGASGAVTVTGEGSLWENNDHLILAGNSLTTSSAGRGTLTIADGGTVSVAGTTRVHANGTVTLQTGGTLQTWILNTSGAFHFAGGTLRAMADHANWITNSGTLSLGTGGGRIDSNGFDVFSSAVFSGSGPFAKLGAGTLTLTGRQTYTGATTVAAGKLVVDGSISSSSLTTVQDGASLGGTGTIGNLHIASGGILSPGNSTGLLTVEGDLALDSAAWTLLELTSLTDFDRIAVSGALTFGGTLAIRFTDGYLPLENDTFALFGGGYTWNGEGMFSNLDFSNPAYTGIFDYDTGVLTIVAVPEPSVYGLMIAAFVAHVLLRCRRHGA